MPRRRGRLLVFGFPALWLAACGGGGGGEDPLAVYGGRFQVVEMFYDQSGSACPAPPADTENEVRITIQKNDFTAVFSQRWGWMVGQINRDTSYQAVNTEPAPDLALKFTGRYPDVDHFQGMMTETMPGCTRQRQLLGTRAGGTP